MVSNESSRMSWPDEFAQLSERGKKTINLRQKSQSMVMNLNRSLDIIEKNTNSAPKMKDYGEVDWCLTKVTPNSDHLHPFHTWKLWSWRYKTIFKLLISIRACQLEGTGPLLTQSGLNYENLTCQNDVGKSNSLYCFSQSWCRSEVRNRPIDTP